MSDGPKGGHRRHCECVGVSQAPRMVDGRQRWLVGWLEGKKCADPEEKARVQRLTGRMVQASRISFASIFNRFSAALSRVDFFTRKPGSLALHPSRLTLFWTHSSRDMLDRRRPSTDDSSTNEVFNPSCKREQLYFVLSRNSVQVIFPPINDPSNHRPRQASHRSHTDSPHSPKTAMAP